MSYRANSTMALGCCGNCRPLGQDEAPPQQLSLVSVLAVLAVVAGGVWVWRHG